MNSTTTVTNLSDDATKVVQNLITLTMDSVKGYREAAELVDQPMLAKNFSDIAASREGYVAHLQTLVRSGTSEEPNDDGSVSGSLHRGWMKLRSAVQSNDTAAVLAEIERGEGKLADEYEGAARDLQPHPAAEQIHRFYAEVKQDERIATLRREAAKTSDS